MMGQNGIIKGRVFDESNNQPVPFASIAIYQTTQGTTSDVDGNYSITGLTPGYYQLAVSAVGYETRITADFQVTNARVIYIDVSMHPQEVQLKEVTIMPSPFERDEESPLSVRTLQISDIEKSPGGNRDVSKVIQILPGVASTPAYRNDVIVRGGGPSENAFYLDDIEIPNLNHFATQGASGGPQGIINADFIREVEFYSGAFPADQGKALSSMINMKLIDGNRDKLVFRGSLGATDLAVTLNGPLTKKSTFLISYRRSYLQFLFDVLGLPFLPTYNDLLLKYKLNIDQKNEISFIMLGSIDQFKLNTGLKNPDATQQYILDFIPKNEQWSYTVGAVYKHFHKYGYTSVVLSRYMLNNRSIKYQNNVETDSNLVYDYNSYESENKLRAEHNSQRGDWKFNYGAGLDYGRYTNTTFQRTYSTAGPDTINYDSKINLLLWNVFGQVSKNFFRDRLVLSAGLRMDANNYDNYMSNLFHQVSPRFSASYSLTEKFTLNFNTARYYQRPPYTTFGFMNNDEVLVNKVNNLKYMSADHVVLGVAYLPESDSKISLEGFYKHYNDYPFSVADSINIASKGADFGTFGDEEVLSISKGRTYGLEVSWQDKSFYKFNIILSYTLVWSEFTDKYQHYVPSSWDNRNILNITVMREFKRNWQVGAKWRFVGGSPYTPADLALSSMRPAWDVRGREYPNYDQFNEVRLKAFHQLDIRVDKTWFWDKWSLNLYADVQNIYNFQSESPPIYSNLDANGNPDIINPNAPYEDQLYQLRQLDNVSGTILPSIGIIVEL
jgi:outer membrane receptor protein involved in Fe transport